MNTNTTSVIEPAALDFINSFLDAEYALTQQMAREDLDAADYDTLKRDFAQTYYNGAIETHMTRLRQPDHPAFAEIHDQIRERTFRRALFVVRSYNYPSWGVLYRAYVSVNFATKRYATSLFITLIDGAYKIIAVYRIGRTRTRWEWADGKKFKEWGEFRAVLHLKPPTDPLDLADYESKAGSDTPRAEKVTKAAASIGPSAERDTFIAQHGPVSEGAEINGSLSTCLELLGGRFYTNGFFRDGTNPQAADLPWPQLSEALLLASEWAETLRAGGCSALNSEGDRPFFPFVYAGNIQAGLPDFVATNDIPPGAVVRYDEQLANYTCVFWGDDMAEDYADDLAPASIAAFNGVSMHMKAALRQMVEFIIVHPDKTAHPLIIGDTDKNQLFVGVVTEQVWT